MQVGQMSINANTGQVIDAYMKGIHSIALYFQDLYEKIKTLPLFFFFLGEFLFLIISYRKVYIWMDMEFIL